MPPIGKLSDLGVIFPLLPGFISLLIVKQFTARERRLDVTESVIHALAYTLASYAVWTVCASVGTWIPTPEIVGLTLSAVAVGCVVSIMLNNRWAFRFARKVRLTRQPEFSSVWETAFRLSEHELGNYIVVELDDDRRIRGAIRGVSPSQPDGHICLERCAWLTDDPSPGQIELPGWFLIPGDRVKSVHFLDQKGGIT